MKFFGTREVHLYTLICLKSKNNILPFRFGQLTFYQKCLSCTYIYVTNFDFIQRDLKKLFQYKVILKYNYANWPVPSLPWGLFSWRSPPWCRCQGSASPGRLAPAPSAELMWTSSWFFSVFSFPSTSLRVRRTLCMEARLKRKFHLKTEILS